MNIYLLEAIEQDLNKRGKDLQYDCNYGFVLIASCVRKARQLASKVAGDEGSAYWLDIKLSKIKKIGVSKSKTMKMVLRDYNNA